MTGQQGKTNGVQGMPRREGETIKRCHREIRHGVRFAGTGALGAAFDLAINSGRTGPGRDHHQGYFPIVVGNQHEGEQGVPKYSVTKAADRGKKWPDHSPTIDAIQADAEIRFEAGEAAGVHDASSGL